MSQERKPANTKYSDPLYEDYFQMLYKLWNDDCTATIIARKLNSSFPDLMLTTRNMVIGQATRQKERDLKNGTSKITKQVIKIDPDFLPNFIKKHDAAPNRPVLKLRPAKPPKLNKNSSTGVAVIQPKTYVIRNLNNIVVPSNREFVADTWVSLEDTHDFGCRKTDDGHLYCNLPCSNNPSGIKSSYCINHYISNTKLQSKKVIPKTKAWRFF